jgi:hypothetical protein
MKTVIRRHSPLLKMVGLPALTAATALALQLPAEARLAPSGRVSTSPVYWGDTIVGSSTLVRTPNGISFTYHTSGLPAGYAVTLWIVVFNNPAACFTRPCTDVDIFSNPDAQADFLHGAGHVIGGSGVGNFGGHLAVGDTSQSGLAELIGGPTVGLLDPMNAEIQMAIHSHGPAVPGPTLKAQLSSFLGGCRVLLDEVDFPDEVGECVTFQSSIHQ